VFHKKTTPLIVLYLCQILDNLFKNFPVCTLGNVLPSTINPFSPVWCICTSMHNPCQCTYTSWHHRFKWNNHTRPDCKCI